MALTDRERKIMIMAVSAVLILVANQYVLSPVMEKRDEVKQTRIELAEQVEQSLASLERKKVLRQRWVQMQENGLGSDVQRAESMIYRFLEETSARSGLEVGSIQPDRRQVQEKLGEIDFVISGTGSMSSVIRFLWNLETAQIPLRIKSYQLGSKNETGQEMTLQLELSTVYLQDEMQSKEES
jgi:Tfp pilus assembly protein PilO